VRAIAVPVRSSDGEVLTAMSVIAHASRVDVDTIVRDFLPPLKEAAAAVADELALLP
jgi:DNA-binding IclR family transcriptional regulator